MKTVIQNKSTITTDAEANTQEEAKSLRAAIKATKARAKAEANTQRYNIHSKLPQRVIAALAVVGD